MSARPATPADIDELVRLRAVMLRGFHRGPWDDDWREPARRIFAEQMAGTAPRMAAFVVDHPGEPLLAACAVGTIEQRLGSPGNPQGRAGYVFSVVTDPAMRRRGYSRACLTALLAWFAEQGIRKVDLRASADGEPLYTSLGFVRTADPSMRLQIG